MSDVNKGNSVLFITEMSLFRQSEGAIFFREIDQIEWRNESYGLANNIL
jgi:hypothetical protein